MTRKYSSNLQVAQQLFMYCASLLYMGQALSPLLLNSLQLLCSLSLLAQLGFCCFLLFYFFGIMVFIAVTLWDYSVLDISYGKSLHIIWWIRLEFWIQPYSLPTNEKQLLFSF